MAEASNSHSIKTVACPQCRGPSVYGSNNSFRPFCSERCKNLDFGAWASEDFKLPEQNPDSDPEFEQS